MSNQIKTTTNIPAILEQNGFEKISDNIEEILKFVQNMKGGEHVIFLWENEESKNRMISEFFNQQHRDKAVEKVTRAISVKDSKKSIRYAFEDDTWLMKRGLKKEVLDTEKALGKEVDKNLSLFCMNHRHNIDDDEETIEKLIKAHGYVLIDVPLALYKWRGGNIVAADTSNNNPPTLTEKCDC